MSHNDDQINIASPFARRLKQLIDEKRFSVKEFADVCDCSERHIYNVAAGIGQMNVDRADDLRRWLCAHGETRLSDPAFTAEYELMRREPSGRADGRIDDELTDLMVNMGDAAKAHRERNRETLTARIEEMENEILPRLKAERDRL